MSLPIQRRKDRIILYLSKKLYPSRAITQAINEYSKIAKKLKTQKPCKYQKIELEVSRLKEALEWTNYLFYLNR